MIQKQTREDIIFDTVNLIICSLALVLAMYPLYLVLIDSFSSPEYVYNGRVWLWPRVREAWRT